MVDEEDGPPTDVVRQPPGARVEAGANLRIEGGVIGRGFARIEAGGDAYVHHASHVPIDVQGTLELGDHVVDCSVRAAAVLAENGRGSIVGGKIPILR